MRVLEERFPDWRALAIHESSPSDCALTQKFRQECPLYTETQFFPAVISGTPGPGSIRCENLETQTFADETFDIVITQDVFEHIYDARKAFAEIARTLKPGGTHIFTVPLVNKWKISERWAIAGTDGRPIFLKGEEWHGNPVDKKGSPVTMHWGYDIVEFIRESSGLGTDIEYINDLSEGIRAEYIEVLVTQKPRL